VRRAFAPIGGFAKTLVWLSVDAMNSDETVDCGVHGRQAISFVCTHIAHGLLDGTTPGFVIAPEDDHPLPLGWCDECEAMVQGLGGDWTDEAAARAEFTLLCAQCYVEAKGVAISANRFRNFGNRSASC
jgi:hypothetical protein